ncbi:MAG: site-specific DNA-methyltransferase [Paludibacteraceae bacterium]|nr:site-specific DNA-methyltransferase [Paludibacteraceae bacterium]
MEYTRAKNNRTITVLPEEVSGLRQHISLPSALDVGDDLYDLLINGDLFDVVDKIPDGFADLIILDPPYNLTKDFNGTTFRSCSRKDYLDYLGTWFSKVCCKLKSNGSLYFCGDWHSTAALQMIMEKELTVINRITWQREKGRGAISNWKNSMEDIWFGVKDPNDYYFNVNAVKLKRRVLAPYRKNGVAKDWQETDDGKFRETYPSNFWDDISVPFWSMPENTDHPTQKPEKLIAKLILASSRPGDIVFDPFLGSGTTAVVAKKLARHFLGVEINEEYCLWAAKRLMNAEQDNSIQGYCDGVFWERNTLQEQKKKELTKVRHNKTGRELQQELLLID